MRTVRYVFTIAIVSVILLTLFGCGGGGSDQEPEYPEARLHTYCTQHPANCNN